MNLQLEKQLFQVIPLRKSLIPKYMLVNTKELGISQTKLVQKIKRI